MSRLCGLMAELSQIRCMKFLSFELKYKAIEYYEREIAALKPFGDGKDGEK